MAQAQTPRGINHVVLNVRDIEVSHRFWTEVMGFRCVAELKQRPDRVRPKMKSRVAPGRLSSPPKCHARAEFLLTAAAGSKLLPTGETSASLFFAPNSKR